MDIQKKLKSVEKKIVSLKYDFNEEDIFLIRNNEKLTREYIISLSNDPNIWQNHSLPTIEDISIDYLKGTELTNVIENILFSHCLTNSLLNFSYIDELVRSYLCPTGTRDYLARKYTDIILSGKYDLYYNCDTYALAILIKNDKRDIISKIKTFADSISDKTLEKYLQYCAKNQITPVLDIDKKSKEPNLKYLDYFSLEDLIRMMIHYNSNLQVYNKVIERINNHQGEIKLDTVFSALYFELPPERANSIYKALYDKGYFVYANELTKNKIISVEEYRKKIREYCLSRKNLDDRVLTRSVSYLKDKDILLHIASSNSIRILFSKDLCEEVKKYKKQIIENLLANKNLPKLLKELTFNDICTNPELTLELAKRGLFDSLRYDINNTDIEKEEIKLLDKLLDNYNIKLEIIIKKNNNNTNLLAFLIKRDYLYEFIKLSTYSEYSINLINKNTDGIIAFLDQNIIALNLFTEKFVQLILDNDKLLSFYADNDFYLTELLLSKIKLVTYRNPLTNEKLYTSKLYKRFKKNIIILYNIREENLEILYERFGPTIIAYLEYENIRKLANLDKQDLKNILDLFPNVELSIDDLSKAYLSIREYTFPIENPKDAQIFSYLQQAIKDDKQEDINYIINLIDNYFDKKLFDILNKKYILSENGFTCDNHHNLLLFIVAKVKTSPNKEKYLNLLHIICNYYVACKRTEYADIYNMGRILDLQFDYDDTNLDEKITKYIFKYDSDAKRIKEVLDALFKSGFSKDEIVDIISLIKGEKKYEEIPSNTIAKIKQFRTVVYEFVNNKGYLLLYQTLIKQDKRIKLDRVYNLKGTKKLNLLKILANIKPDNIIAIINGNPLVYTSLKELLSKKKIHLLPTSISNILETPNVSVIYSEENIATIINYYPEIYSFEQKKDYNRKKRKLVAITQKINEQIISGNEKTQEKMSKKKKKLEEELTGNTPVEMSTIQALLSADAYDAISSVFSLILTPEDARLIKDNPEPNSAHQKSKNNQRLKEAVELTKVLFTRSEVTIPTSNRILEVNEDTRVRVIVGNFTDSCNLTYGERTYSCMRIGGVGENLFLNALTNKNCFHVKFEDPTTGNFLSRVTGFRLGNTVFFNQLNESIDEKIISDEELIEAIKIISRSIIKDSKNSSFPIENVIISREDVFQLYEPSVDLQILEKGESLGEIYNDVTTSDCVVLATTAKEEPFAPINFNKDNYPIYPTARRTIRRINNKQEMSVYVNRVEAVKKLLAGEDYRLLTKKEIDQEILYGLANDEWYIFVDNTGSIHKNYLSTDKRAEDEFLEELEKIETEILALREGDKKWNLS